MYGGFYFVCDHGKHRNASTILVETPEEGINIIVIMITIMIQT